VPPSVKELVKCGTETIRGSAARTAALVVEESLFETMCLGAEFSDAK
jgi:hypothetical protein